MRIFLFFLLQKKRKVLIQNVKFPSFVTLEENKLDRQFNNNFQFSSQKKKGSNFKNISFAIQQKDSNKKQDKCLVKNPRDEIKKFCSPSS